MWHGGGQTGTNFLGTPDGRPGWADYFLQQGYAVYIVDQPGRARSGFFTEVYGKTRRPNANAMSRRFTAPALANQYPQAHPHTQWPGKGVAGDPVFDQFFASQVEDIADVSVIEQLNREAGIALLDKIGPAILLTHSQSGPFSWVLADARPKLVNGLLAVEPNGPPFYENTVIGTPDWFKDGTVGRAWGVTRGPLTYNPPAAAPGDLGMVRQTAADGPDLVRCWLQLQPAAQTPEPARHHNADRRERGVVPRTIRSLHRKVSGASRGQEHVCSSTRSRHPRQWPPDDAGKEQHGYRHISREVSAAEYPMSSSGNLATSTRHGPIPTLTLH